MATVTSQQGIWRVCCVRAESPHRWSEIIRAAATIAGSAVQDCVNIAQSTVTKFRAGEKVTGGPKLAETLGDDVVAKIRGWLKLADLDRVEAMNDKHFWVRIGKDDVIGREDTASGDVVFQRVRSLYSEYANQQVKIGEDKNGDAKFKPFFPTWLESPTRRSYREVVFLPPPPVADSRD